MKIRLTDTQNQKKYSIQHLRKVVIKDINLQGHHTQQFLRNYNTIFPFLHIKDNPYLWGQTQTKYLKAMEQQT